MNPFKDGTKEVSIRISSTSTPNNPDNHNFKFRKLLPEAVSIEKGEEWEVGLVSITAATIRNSCEKHSKFKIPKKVTPVMLQEFQLSELWWVNETLEEFERRMLVRFEDENFENEGLETMSLFRAEIKRRQKSVKKAREKFGEFFGVSLPSVAHRIEYDRFDAALRKENQELRFYLARYRVLSKYFFGRKTADIAPNFEPLKVHLGGVEGEDYIKETIANFVIKGMTENQDADFYTYEPKNVFYFPMCTSYLSSIALWMSDGWISTREAIDNPNCALVAPTFTTLTFRKKNKKKGSMEIRGCYIESKETDDPLDFHAALPSFLDKPSERNTWEIALIKAIIPHAYLAVPQTSQFTLSEMVEWRYTDHPERGVMYGTTRRQIEECLDPEHLINGNLYHRIHEVFFEHNPNQTDILSLLESMFEQATQPDLMYNEEDYADRAQELPESRSKFQLLVNEQGKLCIYSNRCFNITMPSVIASALGLKARLQLDETYCVIDFKDTWLRPNDLELRHMPFTDEERETDEFHDTLAREEKRYRLESDWPIQMSLLKVPNVLLQTSCVHPTLRSDFRSSQYLCNIPLTQTNQYYTEYEPQHPIYHKMSISNIDHVNFKITQLNEKLPKLEYKDVIFNHKTFLTFSFRRAIK